MRKRTPTYTILGIDPGLAFTGFAVARVKGRSDVIEAVQTFGLLESRAHYINGDESAGLMLRASALHEHLAWCVEEYQVDAIACEMPFISKQLKANFLHGLAMGAIAALNLPAMLVTPREVKAAAATKAASKREVTPWALRVTAEDQIPWPTSQVPNTLGLSFEGKQVAAYAVHLADALAAIQAGIRTAEWLTAPDRD